MNLRIMWKQTNKYNIIFVFKQRVLKILKQIYSHVLINIVYLDIFIFNVNIVKHMTEI